MKRLIADRAGVVAIEFAMSAALLLTLLMGIADLGLYQYRRMQVDGATFAVARAVFAACGAKSLPALDKCRGVTDTATDAASNSSIGIRATMTIDEYYFCTDGSDRFFKNGKPKKPKKCKGKKGKDRNAGGFIEVTMSYEFEPLFAGSSIAALLPLTISRTAMLQLQ